MTHTAAWPPHRAGTLLVDDSHTSRTLPARRLEQQGDRASTAKNSKATLNCGAH